MDTQYKSLWNRKAESMTGALLAVDGSSTEAVALATGAYSARQVATALDLKGHERILEIGCGVGRIGLPLLDKVAHWHGVDIADNMIKQAGERLSGRSNVSLTALDRAELSGVADASLDAAYCVAVFIHMDKEDFFLYLRELKRCVKPGGLIYFDHWNLAHPLGFKRFDYEVGNWQRSEQTQRKDVARNQFCTPQEIQLYLDHAGFGTLALFSDSPWVQAVAINGDIDTAAAAQRARVLQQREQIAYTANWSRYFDQLMQVIFEGRPMDEVSAWLDAEPESEDRRVFSIWLSELTKHETGATGCTT